MNWEQDDLFDDQFELRATDGSMSFYIRPPDYAEDMWSVYIWYPMGNPIFLEAFESTEEAKAFVEKLVKGIKTIE